MRTPRSLPSAALLTGLLLGSCAATGDDTLHPRWADLDAFAFEQWLEATFPGTDETQLSRADRDELRATLDRPGALGVRAAVILARHRTPDADELLLRRLERRVASTERAADAGDVVAATALIHGPLAARDPEGVRGRLAQLALDPDPHPDLEVRVQCGAAALDLGADAVIPFLLRVLLIDTPRGLRRPVAWAEVERSAWARSSAADALARRAGVENTYRADASPADRELETAKLRARLAP